MTHRYRDEEILRALPYARGMDRESLIIALGRSVGTEGPPELQRIFETEKGQNRMDALQCLARRTGTKSIPACITALHSSSQLLQGVGAALLADFADASVGAEMLGWLNRRLGRKKRSRTWDSTELPTGIAFGVRHGLHEQVAMVIIRHWDNLEDDERTWLSRTWPSLLTRDGTPTAAPELVGPPAYLQSDVYRDERPHLENPEPDPEWDEEIDKALARSQRRAARAATHA